MPTLVTLAVAVPLLFAASRLLWPRAGRPPLPLYAVTIALVFFAGLMAGAIVGGRDLGDSARKAAVLAAAITVVAVVSWFRITPAAPSGGPAGRAPATRKDARHPPERD